MGLVGGVFPGEENRILKKELGDRSAGKEKIKVSN